MRLHRHQQGGAPSPAALAVALAQTTRPLAPTRARFPPAGCENVPLRHAGRDGVRADGRPRAGVLQTARAHRSRRAGHARGARPRPPRPRPRRRRARRRLSPPKRISRQVRVPGTAFILDPVVAAFNIGAAVRWLEYSDAFLAAEWHVPPARPRAPAPLMRAPAPPQGEPVRHGCRGARDGGVRELGAPRAGPAAAGDARRAGGADQGVRGGGRAGGGQRDERHRRRRAALHARRRSCRLHAPTRGRPGGGRRRVQPGARGRASHASAAHCGHPRRRRRARGRRSWMLRGCAASATSPASTAARAGPRATPRRARCGWRSWRCAASRAARSCSPPLFGASRRVCVARRR